MNNTYGPKLSAEQVSQIIARYRGGETVSQLATEFNVNRSAIQYHLKVRLIDARPRPAAAPRATKRYRYAGSLDPSWREKAACRSGIDPEEFFANEVGSPMARLCCEGCPVQSRCLDEALAVPSHLDRWGTRGGLTPRQRNALRRAAS